ncbi:MAG: hypothetical protein ACRCVW_00145 [Brevinema sp.]
MKLNESINVVTGFLGFITWTVLSYYSSQDSLVIALGCLAMLMGFGGRDTIIEIIKSYKDK